jgi:hypothetical protein
MYKNLQVTRKENVYKLHTLLLITVQARVTRELQNCIITVMITRYPSPNISVAKLRNKHMDLVGKCEGKRPLGRTRHRW